jgi:hypothetical protein
MAVFSEDQHDRLDWHLMQDGAVTLYFQSAILEADLAWLRTQGYIVQTIDCSDYTGFQQQMSTALRFKEQFGYDQWSGNLNALHDAFRYLDMDASTGLVFCFLRYDLLCKAHPEVGHAVLEILEYHSRDYLMLGHRLLALVQSNDPEIHFEDLGARSARWNHKEQLNKHRGL